MLSLKENNIIFKQSYRGAPTRAIEFFRDCLGNIKVINKKFYKINDHTNQKIVKISKIFASKLILFANNNVLFHTNILSDDIDKDVKKIILENKLFANEVRSGEHLLNPIERIVIEKTKINLEKKGS